MRNFMDWIRPIMDRALKLENDYYEKTGKVKSVTKFLKKARKQIEEEK